jgi:hypothetical protein
VPLQRTAAKGEGRVGCDGGADIEHIGSAHDDAELEVLKAAARQQMAPSTCPAA